MNPLYRFVDVRSEVSEAACSFTLHAGELRVFHANAKDEKSAMIDCAIGESSCREGTIELAQGERRYHQLAVPEAGERRSRDEPFPLEWQPLASGRNGRVGWVAANGGMVSNLRIWENIVLPLWYHSRRELVETEQVVAQWLEALCLEPQAQARFMEAQPYSVELWQLKLAGLVRALLLKPQVLVVDAALFDNIRGRIANCWIMAIEAYAAEGRAVLVITDRETSLPWQKLE